MTLPWCVCSDSFLDHVNDSVIRSIPWDNSISVNKVIIVDPLVTLSDRDHLRFLLWREHIIEDTFQKLQHTHPQDLTNHVTFLGEPAIDEGDPGQECFFFLFLCYFSVVWTFWSTNHFSQHQELD